MRAPTLSVFRFNLVAKVRGWRPWSFILLGILLLLASIVVLRSTSGTVENTALVAQEIATLTPDEVAALLLRGGFGPNDTQLDILYAPTWYYEWNQRTLPQTDQPVLAFFVMETIHQGMLVDEPPSPLLQVGSDQLEPLEVQVISNAPHHRVTQVLYSALNQAGQPLVTDDSQQLVLTAPIDGMVSGSNTFRWDLPLPYGLGLVNDTAQSKSLTMNSSRTLTWPVFLAIMAGMMTALSPCLLQLAAYYAAVLAGAGVGTDNLSHTRKHLVRTSLFFVGGFTLVYTAGGFLAGYIGESMQQLTFIQQWSYPVSVIAGVIIILLAIRIAIQARAPLVCRLPLGVNRSHGSGWTSSALMGSTFAVGCLTCFSATVLSALLLYAGSTGSPIIGGLLLLLFSSGVGIVFLLAAWVIGESTPLLGWLQRAQPIIGGISALIIAGFGLLMVTYQFHVVSSFLFGLFAPS